MMKDLAELSPENIFCFKYAPTVSADVERSFSKYKVMLIDNCRSFVFDNSIINSHFHAIAHFKYWYFNCIFSHLILYVIKFFFKCLVFIIHNNYFLAYFWIFKFINMCIFNDKNPGPTHNIIEVGSGHWIVKPVRNTIGKVVVCKMIRFNVAFCKFKRYEYKLTQLFSKNVFFKIQFLDYKTVWFPKRNALWLQLYFHGLVSGK